MNFVSAEQGKQIFPNHFEFFYDMENYEINHGDTERHRAFSLSSSVSFVVQSFVLMRKIMKSTTETTERHRVFSLSSSVSFVVQSFVLMRKIMKSTTETTERHRVFSLSSSASSVV